MKSKLVLILFAVVLVALAATPAAFAQTPTPSAPSDPTALLLLSIAQLVQWVLTFGISGLASYVLDWFPALSVSSRKVISGLIVVILTAIVTYLVGFFTPAQLNMTVLQGVVAVISVVVAWAGHIFGSFKATVQRAQAQALGVSAPRK